MVWLSTNGVAIYENGVAISFSVSRAPCRSQKRSTGLWIGLLHLTSHLMVIFCKLSSGGGFTASSSPNCEVYDEHLSGKKNKSTSYDQGIMSKLIFYDENIWIHFVCLHRLRLDVGDKF